MSLPTKRAKPFRSGYLLAGVLKSAAACQPAQIACSPLSRADMHGRKRLVTSALVTIHASPQAMLALACCLGIETIATPKLRWCHHAARSSRARRSIWVGSQPPSVLPIAAAKKNGSGPHGRPPVHQNTCSAGYAHACAPFLGTTLRGSLPPKFSMANEAAFVLSGQCEHRPGTGQGRTCTC